MIRLYETASDANGARRLYLGGDEVIYDVTDLYEPGGALQDMADLNSEDDPDCFADLPAWRYGEPGAPKIGVPELAPVAVLDGDTFTIHLGVCGYDAQRYLGVYR